MSQFRSEWKYTGTDGQVELVKARLEGILLRDKHANTDGKYQVHSLYFDDYRDSCAADNESGEGIRSKYRLRYYGKDIKTLHFEKKEKQYGLGRKKNCPLSGDEYELLLSGDFCDCFWKTKEPVLKEFCALMMTRGGAPKAVIDYERTAFVDPVTNIRITIDRNITTSYDYSAFLTGDFIHFPFQNNQINILEVKFDEFFPGWLRKMIESLHFQQTTFSKYYLGRKRLESITR